MQFRMNSHRRYNEPVAIRILLGFYIAAYFIIAAMTVAVETAPAALLWVS